MGFIPRTTSPNSSDKHWIQVSSGGYNKCIYVNAPTVMPNCTGYAWGRFIEIMGATTCNLSTHDAGQWYLNTSDGYQRGNTPELGAVVCWKKPGEAGHVAIVEQINADGSILISQSGYRSSKYFWTQTLQPGYKFGTTYIFQGFIYNPSVTNSTSINPESKISKFIAEAKSHVGENSRWTWNTLGCGDIEWCCAFVMACAKTVGGIIDVILPNTYSCTSLARAGGDKQYSSQFIKGPRHGFNIKPLPGDLILFSDGGSVYDSCHVGIVYEVSGEKVLTVEGNTVTWDKYTSKVALREYDYTNKRINGYFRPDWSKVGSSFTDLATSSVGGFGSLYTSMNTRADAAIREVAYINNYIPSTDKTNIRLSVINYTGLLASYFSNSSLSNPNCDVTVSGIDNTVCKACIEYFLGKGLNAAAACGICGNIKHESGFRTDIIEYGYTFSNGGVGLCQWTNYPRNASTGRKTNMVNFVGADWRNNLTGQLDYLWHELTTAYSKRVLEPLKSIPNTESGAKNAADIFVRKFEVPANIDSTSLARQASAAELFNKLLIQQSAVKSI